MEVKFKRNENILAAMISGEIDHHSASVVRREIDGMITACRPKCLILDYDGITFMDSAGIGIAIGRANKMKSTGGQTFIIANDNSVQRILRMSGVFEIMNKSDSIESAIRETARLSAGGGLSGSK